MDISALILCEGNGFGHISRMTGLIKRLNEPVITFHNAVSFSREHNLDVIDLGTPYIIHETDSNVKIKLNLEEMIKMLRPSVLKQLIKLGRKKDVIIADSTLIGPIVGKLLNKPIFYIMSDLNSSTFLPFNLASLGFNSVFRWFKDLHIFIPDFPPPYTISYKNLDKLNGRANYIGPMIFKQRQVKHDWDIYISMGAKEDNKRKIIDLLKNRTFVHNSMVDSFQRYIKYSDIVITHGGHTTLMESLYYGKPVLVAYNSNYKERVNNGIGIEKNRVGIAMDVNKLNHLNIDMILDDVYQMRGRARWFSKWAKTFNPVNEILNNISRVLGNV